MKFATTLLLLVAPVFGQQSQPPTSPLPKIAPADCSLVEHSPACRSFNELLASHDKDVVAFLGGDYFSYVCFEKEEDTFMIFSVSAPVPILYEKEKSTQVQSQRSTVFIQKFKDGVNNDFQFLGGVWKHASGLAEFFYTDPGDQSVSLNDTELTYTETYENLRKTKTHHSFSIRRSTLRFAENYRFPSEDNKATTDIDYTGRCLSFDVKPTPASTQP